MTRPNSTESCLAVPFINNWKARQATKEIKPSVRFCQLPKSLAPSPPPKLVAPTDNSEKPIDVTTMAETIGGTNRRQYLDVRPNATSSRPPSTTAPATAP